MTKLTNQEIFQNLIAAELAAQANPTQALEESLSNLSRKQQDVAQATQKKIQALNELSKSHAARNSTYGQITGLGMDSDLSREFIENTVSGTGSAIKGVGDAAALVGLGEGEWSDTANEYLKGVAGEIDNQQTVDFRNKMIRSTPTGDLFDPSSWDVQDVSMEGVMGLLASMGGQFTPQLAAMFLTRGASLATQTGAAMAVGGAQAGGGAAENAEQYIDNLSHDELLESSEMYRDLIETRTPDEARAAVKEASSKAALLSAGAVGALGGAATNYILRPLASTLNKVPYGGVATTALAAGEEGIQEVAEGVAARAATNARIGGNQDLTEGTFTDFTLGAGFGGAIGGTAAIKEKVSEEANKALEPVRQRAEEKVLYDQASSKDDRESWNELALKNPVKAAEAAKVLHDSGEVEEAKARMSTLLEDSQLDIVLAEKRFNEATDAAQKEQAKKVVESVTKTLDDVSTIAKTMTTEELSKKYDAQTIEETTKAIVSQIQEGNQDGIDDLTQLAMSNPEALTLDDISNVIASGTLDANQKKYFESFKVVRKATEAITESSVTSDVMSGGEGKIGLTQYNQSVNTNLLNGKTEQARQAIEPLKRFSRQHSSKRDMATEALNKYQNTGTASSILPTNDGAWRIAEGLTKEQARNAGGLYIDGKSAGVVNSIVAEANAITATYEQLKAAINLHDKKGTGSPGNPTQQVVSSLETKPTNKQPDMHSNTKNEQMANEQKEEKKSQTEQVAEETKQGLSLEKVEGKGVIDSNPSVNQEVKKDSTKENSETSASPDPETDRINAYFLQVSEGKPLVTFNNFVTNYLQNKQDVVAAVHKNESLNEVQTKNLSHYFQTLQKWNTTVNQLVSDKSSKMDYRNPVLLLREDNVLPENVASAISTAAYVWVTENAGSAIRSKKEINDMLGRDENQIISNKEKVLHTAGMNQLNVVASLGTTAMEVLGYKPKPDAPKDDVNRLRTSLGLHSLALLHGLDYVQRVEVDTTIFDEPGKERDPNEKVYPTSFVRINRFSSNGQLQPLPEEIQTHVDTNRGTGGIVREIHRSEKQKTGPTTKPIKGIQKFAKRSKQLVSKLQKQILQGEQEKAHYLRDDMVSIYQALPEATRKRIAGIEDLKGKIIHKVNKEATEARNDALERELDHLDEFLETFKNNGEDFNTPFYFGRSVWRIFRVGLDSNTVNPQTSKIHRHMLKMGGWNIKIDKTNTQQMQNFKLGVAEALGIGTDKQVNSISLLEFDIKINEPGIQQAIEALKAHKQGEAFNPDALAVVDSFHMLEGLSAYADMELAESSFETSLMREVDGVTNGPMLTMAQLGAATDADALGRTLTRGGFLPESINQTFYTDWRGTPGNQDLYESVAESIHNISSRIVLEKPHLAKAFDATQFFLGEFVNEDGVTKDGRNIAKTPITGYTFGSSMNTAISNMTNKLIESFYTKLEEAVAANDPMLVRETIEHINELLPTRMKLSVNIPMDDVLETTLSQNHLSLINTGVMRTLGVAVSEAMEKQFGHLGDTRTVLNTAGKYMYKLYDVAYKKAREQYIKENIEHWTNKKGQQVPVRDLTTREEQIVQDKVKALNPVVHTAMSKLSGELGAGIKVASQANKKSDNPLNQVESSFKAKITLGNGETVKSLKSQSMELKESEPGVGMVVNLIHAMDSTISGLAYSKRPALNIHDAHGLGLADVEKGANELNKQTFEVLKNYHLTLEVYEAYKRTVTAFNEFASNDPETFQELQKEYSVIASSFAKEINSLSKRGILPKTKGVDPFITFDRLLRNEATRTTKIKLEALMKLSHVDQYALEGGSYELSAKDKQALEEELTRINQYEADNPSIVEVVAEKEANEELESSPFGLVGTSLGNNVSEIVNLFNEKTEMTAQELSKGLVAYLKTSRLKEAFFHRAILKRINQLLTSDIKVKLLTPDSPASAYPAMTANLKIANGWYDRKDKTIYLKSPEFRESNLNSELIVHELLHVVLMGHVNRPGPKSAKAFNELESLRKAAKKYAEEQGINQQYGNAFDNVHEIISWGLTNTAFQQNVLAKIQLPTKNKNLLITGFKKFVGLLVTIVFGETQPEGWQTTGMTNLLVNTSIMFQNLEAEQVTTPGAETGKPDGESPVVLAQQSTKQPRHYTTQEVFDGLLQYGAIHDSSQKQYLKNLLDEIVSKLHGPFGAYAHLEDKKSAGSPEQVFLKSLATGEQPFVGKSVSELRLTESEGFVLQQVQITLAAAFESKHINYSELNRLYNEARKAIKPTDLPNGVWDYIFSESTQAKNHSDYLSRFAAIGLVYKPLRDKLGEVNRAPAQIPYSDRSLVNWLQRLFSRVMSAMSRQLPDVYGGQKQNQALKNLVSNLVDLEAREKHKLQGDMDYSPSRVEEITHKASEKLRKAVASASRSPIVEKLPIETLKAAVKVTGTVVGDKGDKMVDAVEDLRNRSRQGRQKFMDEFITEVKGVGNKAMASLLRMSNKHQQDRQFIIDQIAEGVLTSFENEGKDLTPEQKSALTRTVLRADLSSLVNEFDIEGVASLILNPSNLDDAIDKVSQRLTGPNRHYYLRQSKDLGYFLATGRSSNANLMLNATTIAYLANTRKVIQGDNQLAASNEPTIDALASLYALKYLPDSVIESAREVVRKEIKRPGDNGIATLLKVHQRTQREAFETSFGNNPFSFMKGYTREQFNPHRSLVLVDAKDVPELIKRGYKPEGELQIDKADPDQSSKVMMYIDKGIQPYTTGIVSYSGKRSRGTTIHDGLTSSTGDTFYVGNKLTNDHIYSKKKADIDRMFKPNPGYDPSKAKQTSHMVPVIGNKGKAINYRYMMTEDVKDRVLERNNAVTDVLGAMAGSTFDKQETEVLNSQVIQALKEEFDSGYTGNAQAYITFGPNSTDPVIKENYAMLPDSAKKEIKRIWGSTDIKIRADQYNLVFGYRKYSLGDIWNKRPEERQIMERIFVTVVEQLLLQGKKSELRVRQAENIWKEAVLTTKDIIVIKNLFTLMGNISANVSLLLWQGVSPTAIVKDHVTAIKGITNYQRDHKELFHITNMIESDLLGNHTLQELEQRKAELEDLIAKNPVKELVDAGMFQTIIEDVTKSDDRFSYESQMEQKLSENTKWVPDVVKKVGKHVLVAHDTPLYKLLHDTTAISDFVARYTLHQHLMKRIEEPMTKEESLHAISEAFVNYDIPAGRGMEYLNDVGIFWFTRYFLRIQKVLFRLFRENPARGIGLAMLGNLFPTVPTVVESSFYNQIGNPIGDGAFALPEAVDEIITLKAASAVF